MTKEIGNCIKIIEGIIRENPLTTCRIVEYSESPRKFYISLGYLEYSTAIRKRFFAKTRSFTEISFIIRQHNDTRTR